MYAFQSKIGMSATKHVSCTTSFFEKTEMNTSSGNLSATSPMSQPAQSLVMSSPGVGGDGSVTLTLADTQSMLSAGLDAVTLNITSQVSTVC